MRDIYLYFVRFLLRIIARCSHNAFCLPLPLPFVYRFINSMTNKEVVKRTIQSKALWRTADTREEYFSMAIHEDTR